MAVRDFDTYFAELGDNKEKNGFTYKGEFYEMPRTLPVAVMMKILDLKKRGADVASEEDGLEMITLLFGADNFKRLSAKGMTVAEMELMFAELMKDYAPQQQEKANTSGPKGKQTAAKK